jgi:hypothetical protein
MCRAHALRMGRGWYSTMGIAWLLGMVILLVWASPVHGESANNRTARSASARAGDSGGPRAGASVESPTGSAATPGGGASAGVRPDFSVAARGGSSAGTSPGGASVGQIPYDPGRHPQTGFWPIGSSGVPTPPAAASPMALPPGTTNPGDGGISLQQQSSPPEPSDKSSPPAVPSGSGTSVLPRIASPPSGSNPLPSEPAASGKTDGPHGTGLPSRPARLREGSRISQQKGTFTITGDRVVFSTLNGDLPKMVVLENLSLQRVLQNIQGSPEQEIWLVTGRVTEFQGTNYLLLERATRIDEADLEQSSLAPSAWISQPAVPPASDKSATAAAPSAPAAEVVQPKPSASNR